MTSSAQPSPFSTKQLLQAALVAFTAGSAQAVEAANATSTNNPNFGKVTSAKGQCVIGNPTTYVTREDVDWVWKNTMSKYVPQFKNLIFDQIVTNKGKLSYCVRWDNNQKLTKAVASKFQSMIQSQMDLWNQWLVRYKCWPYRKIDIAVVGFAVHDKSIMDWDDDSLGTIKEREHFESARATGLSLLVVQRRLEKKGGCQEGSRLESEIEKHQCKPDGNAT
ncbi:hypothetical protein PF005_g14422 [Phytophthora fragariae]|uniref:Uncharacterized protein n=1 Tax=Phytophthora fragariae TaxID=53985 RepID=A0A6A3EPS4_9STRA|nr:hypothetical protein PF009_g15532 [Phytophthora fragariae]KAE9007208.1 hypothetical protein PF011_g11230 [Phytophthora fragariae]KAE9092674.1 hypothetical protein PF007_g18391 [Phytophthora fragariae]KAE9140608.1 hypothetical protein PF006_g13496 [Phytophthora fragariae]KAE9202844.1 hypothetical protein PF005_g14422 [Phytophthora fragariae]